MNGEMFDLYVETQLSPTLREGDVVILDNLSSYKSPAAARTFLPPRQLSGIALMMINAAAVGTPCGISKALKPVNLIGIFIRASGA